MSAGGGKPLGGELAADPGDGPGIAPDRLGDDHVAPAWSRLAGIGLQQHARPALVQGGGGAPPEDGGALGALVGGEADNLLFAGQVGHLQKSSETIRNLGSLPLLSGHGND